MATKTKSKTKSGRGTTARKAPRSVAPKRRATTKAAAPKKRAAAKPAKAAAPKKRAQVKPAKATAKSTTKKPTAARAAKAPKTARGSGPQRERSAASMKASAELTPVQTRTRFEGDDPATVAFVTGHHSTDPEVDELARDALRAATSGQDEQEDQTSEESMAELGGPFVETSEATEIGFGDEAPNVEDAEAAAVPTVHTTERDEAEEEDDGLELPDVPARSTRTRDHGEGSMDGHGERVLAAMRAAGVTDDDEDEDEPRTAEPLSF